MNRRSAIKNGFLATLAASIIPFPKLPPTYHFIGTGRNGGRILESMYRNGARGKYTLITDIDDVTCGVPDLELITGEEVGYHKHAFFYGVDQVQEISFPHDVINGPDRPSMTILLSDFLGCYWSMVSIPLLVDLLEKQNHFSGASLLSRWATQYWSDPKRRRFVTSEATRAASLR